MYLHFKVIYYFIFIYLLHVIHVILFYLHKNILIDMINFSSAAGGSDLLDQGIYFLIEKPCNCILLLGK